MLFAEAYSSMFSSGLPLTYCFWCHLGRISKCCQSLIFVIFPISISLLLIGQPLCCLPPRHQRRKTRFDIQLFEIFELSSVTLCALGKFPLTRIIFRWSLNVTENGWLFPWFQKCLKHFLSTNIGSFLSFLLSLLQEVEVSSLSFSLFTRQSLTMSSSACLRAPSHLLTLPNLANHSP